MQIRKINMFWNRYQYLFAINMAGNFAKKADRFFGTLLSAVVSAHLQRYREDLSG